jgi:hypothetical protein
VHDTRPPQPDLYRLSNRTKLIESRPNAANMRLPIVQDYDSKQLVADLFCGPRHIPFDSGARLLGR